MRVSRLDIGRSVQLRWKDEVAGLLQSALVTVLIGSGVFNPASPSYHLEREPLVNGAELITVFGRLQNPASTRGASTRDQSSQPQTSQMDVPLIAVLRDSLGDSDPSNDRLRQVWILTSTRPTLWQRTASALSFGYFRAGSRRHANQVPSAALDLAAPYRSVYSNLASDGLQVLELDPLGAAIRSTTRTYRGNSSDYSKLQVFQALTSSIIFRATHPARPCCPNRSSASFIRGSACPRTPLAAWCASKNCRNITTSSPARSKRPAATTGSCCASAPRLNGLMFEPLAIGERHAQ